MKLMHLGTAAAERIPGIFCKCDICVEALRNGGKEIRTQSQALVDDAILLDFPGDTYFHYIKYHFPLPDIESLLITHWHSDHFYAEDLAYRMDWYANENPSHLTVYGSETVQEFYERAFFLEQHHDHSRITYVPLHPGDHVAIDGGYDAYAFEARHGHHFGDCLFYGLTDGEKSVLYAHDTAPFYASTWEDIQKSGLRFDYVSLDCTAALSSVTSDAHMNFRENLETRDKMIQLGLADETTLFVSNHFSHNGLTTDEHMRQAAEKEGMLVSYDGMTTEF